MNPRNLSSGQWDQRFSKALLLATVALAGCAGTVRVADIDHQTVGTSEAMRAPAAQDQDRLQSYFETLMKDQNPSKEVLRSVAQMVRIYYHAEKELKRFDRELEKASAKNGQVLTELDSYPRMLAYWEVSHQSALRIAYVYDRLLQIRTTMPKKSAEYQKAHEALNALSKYFDHAQGADRLALNGLSLELKDVFDRYSRKAQAAHQKPVVQSFENTLFEKGEPIGEFARRPEVQQELDEKSTTDDSADSEGGIIEDAIERMAPKIREEIQELSRGLREPQAEGLRFFPSSGAHGSVSGSEYPKGVWSITFDDGPSSKYSPLVLDHLRQHGFHSTFFELAMNIHAMPKTSLELLDAGMEMANHSYTHPQLPKLDDAHLRHEIVDSTAVDVKVWGEAHRPKLFRCPYGAGLTVTRVRDMIAKQGFIHVFWNVDTLDWQDKNPKSILARAKKQMIAAGRGIVLFHDIHPQSVESSRMVMDWVKQQGLRHETVGAVIQELNQNAQKKP
jgi:peptidoglycan/xylan/chitin deacetylase (PgdA/CDA1 family)